VLDKSWLYFASVALDAYKMYVRVACESEAHDSFKPEIPLGSLTSLFINHFIKKSLVGDLLNVDFIEEKKALEAL